MAILVKYHVERRACMTVAHALGWHMIRPKGMSVNEIGVGRLSPAVPMDAYNR